ncbi:hypothetical protein OG21DRAFT_1506481 [Imleria badia]|nr:hypothetical protein OG21DRAFT_1506481 [Imleria badia]
MAIVNHQVGIDVLGADLIDTAATLTRTCARTERLGCPSSTSFDCVQELSKILASVTAAGEGAPSRKTGQLYGDRACPENSAIESKYDYIERL